MFCFGSLRYGGFKVQIIYSLVFKRGIFGVNVCVCVSKPRLLSLRCSSWTRSREGRGWGDGAALFVYEILRRDLASVVAGGTKVRIRRNGAAVGNGKQLFEEGGMRARAPAVYIGLRRCSRGCIPALTVGSPDPDPPFSRSTFNECLRARAQSSALSRHFNARTISLVSNVAASCSERLTARGPSGAVAHPWSASKRLTRLSFSRRQRVWRRLRRNQNSWENRIFYMQNKQCGGNKTSSRAVRSFQESIRGLSSASQPLPGNYPSYFMPPSPAYLHTKI